MKKQLMIASAALLLGAFACKKQGVTPPSSVRELRANEASGVVKQKMYDLDNEQTNAVIKSFKNQFTANLNYKSSNTNNQLLALDSSIWLLEAALNSDFDKQRTTESTYTDSIIISATTVNNQINLSDFNTLYLALKNTVAQMQGSDSKIEVIDVKASLTDSTVKYILNIQFFKVGLSQKVASACDPFTTETASPSLHATVIPSYTNFFLSCSGNPSLDGPTVVKDKLNNCYQYSGCTNGFYFTNVITLSGDGLNFTTQIYNHSAISLSDFCLPANKILTATMLNYWKSGCQNWGATHVPSAPTGMAIVTNDITFDITSLACCTGYVPYWTLHVTYGKRVCSNPNSGG